MVIYADTSSGMYLASIGLLYQQPQAIDSPDFLIIISARFNKTLDFVQTKIF